jgi:hypothetical protein
MNHTEAVQTMAVEKYVLDEFDSGEREAFEDHYFSCHECAEELKAAVALLDRGKELFAQDPMPIIERAPQSPSTKRAPAKPAPKDWFAWLRPAFALPALALLLLVVGVQNLYQVPALERALEAPAVLPAVNLGDGSTRGAGGVVVAKAGETFVLTIDLPEYINSAQTVELYDVAGRKKWSLPIPENAPKIGLSLKMPGDLPAGSYSLVVNGTNGGANGGASGDATGAKASPGSSYPFTLQRQ